MSITTEDNRTEELTTDGIETEFDFDMLIYADTEVQVWYEVTGGDYAQLTLDTDYTVVFTDDGGTVTTIGGSSPFAAGKLLIIRHIELTQQTNWIFNDNHTGPQHQDDFDRSVMRDLQMQEELDRCPKFLTSSSTTDIVFPEPLSDNVIGWNTAADALENKAGVLGLTLLPAADGNFIVGDGTAFIVESGATARASMGITFGIANDNTLQVDGTPNSGEYARFTANGLEGRSYAEVLADLSGEASADFDFNGQVVQAADFAKTGWPTTPDITLSFVGGAGAGARTFTVTDGGSAFYYIDGVKYTLGGNKTVVIDDTEGLWYIYFVGDTLTASQTIWSFRNEDKALVAYLYWDATNKKEIYLGWEPHNFHMDGSTHARLHYAGGARWETGLLVSDAGSEVVNVSAGDFWDEDLNIPITDGAGSGLFEQVLSPAELPIYYRDGASAWRIYETADKANAPDVGYVDGSNDLKYNKLNGTWANATVTTGKYVAYWVVATDDQTEPVVLIMGQRIDNTFAAAKVNNIFSGLSLAGLPFEELIVLARLLLKDTGSGVYYTLEEVLDLRAQALGGNITSPLITQHAGLGGLAWSAAGHTFDAAVDFNAQNITNIGTIASGKHTINLSTQVALETIGLHINNDDGVCRILLERSDGVADGAMMLQGNVNGVLFYDSTGMFQFRTATLSDMQAGTPGDNDVTTWTLAANGNVTGTGTLTGHTSASFGNVNINSPANGIGGSGGLTLRGGSGAGFLAAPPASVNTTANAANQWIDSNSPFQWKRSTSSARYKTIDRDMTAEEAAVVLNLRPRKYFSKVDDSDKPFFGLVAEEVETVFPEAAIKGIGYTRDGRFVEYFDGIEKDLTLTQVETIEGWDINFIVAALIKQVQVQHAEIQELKTAV